MTYRPDLPTLPPPFPSYRCECGREFFGALGARKHIEDHPDHAEAER